MARGTDGNPRKTLVRNQLIDKAAELFATRGYARTTMNDIAEELRLKRSSLYHYFRNKEEILDALIEEQTVAPTQMLKGLIARRSGTPLEKIREALTQSILRKLSESARFRVLDQIEFEMPEKQATQHKQMKRAVLELWSRLISDGVLSGDLREIDSRMAAFALLGITNWTAWWYSPGGKLTPEQIASAMTDIGLFGLAAEQNRAQKPEKRVGAIIDALKEQIESLEKLAK
jgi:AcrR family transcriptional regulator